jgi:TolA-binding protein
MHGMLNGLALAVAIGISDHWLSPMLSEIYREPARIWTATADPEVPRSWLRNDPADSIYRLARETLNRRDYRGAADLFAQIPARFPRSGYAGDALYWQAFALYRAGGERDLREALAALRQ